MEKTSPLSAFALDDFESRSGSAASLVRTIAGLYLRHEQSPILRPRLIELAEAAGVLAPAAQTAVSRLIDRGLLENVDSASLRVTDSAKLMFARGNRRIFTPRQMSNSDQWVIVTYSLPESLRATRHQLRKHFIQLGGGLVSAGLWIFPQYLHAEVVQVLQALETRRFATLFTTGTPEFPDGAKQSAAQWWDLTRLAKIHLDFLHTAAKFKAEEVTPAESYRGYVALIDAWRAIPYLDPGLPDYMLPADWPGTKSRARFLELSAAYREDAEAYARCLLANNELKLR